MANRIATVKGPFLRPSISKNGRLYTKDNVATGVESLNQAITAGDYPSVYSSHVAAAADNSLQRVGAITKVWQDPDGTAYFEADIADTAAGRDIAALVTAERPYLKGVSIRGNWVGNPRKVTVKGPDDNDMEAVTADALSIEGIDFTGRPGVAGAEISGSLAEAKPLNIFQIRESSPDEEFFVDTVNEAGNAPGDGKLPYGTQANYADPGYRKDKKKRYPLNTAKRVRAANSYINVPENAAYYTAPQLKRIKSKIKAAAKKFGINITEAEAFLASEMRDVLEAYASMCLSFADGSVNVSGYSDADVLDKLAQKVSVAACAALNALDPDHDDDIDLGAEDKQIAMPAESLDGDIELEACSCGDFYESTANFCPACGEKVTTAEATGATATTESETSNMGETNTSGATTEATPLTADAVQEMIAKAVADATASKGKETKPVTETAPQTFTSEDLQEAVKEALAKAEKKSDKKAAKEAAKAAAGVTESKVLTEADIAEIKTKAIEEARKEVAEEIRKSGVIPRKGLVKESISADSVLTESGDMDPRKLAKLDSQALEAVGRRVFAHAAGSEQMAMAPRLASFLAERG